MRKLFAVLGGFVMSVFLLIIPFGCSDSNNGSSPVPPNVPTNRVYVMTMDSGILSPVVEGAGKETVHTADQSWEYTLTLEDVWKNVLWYTESPEHKSGMETVQDYIDLWPEIYGDVSPNGILD